MSSLIVILVLLALNGFFVAAEFALVKVKKVRLENAAAAGSAAAGLTLRIHGNLEAYLAACQLGITMASLGLGWVGEPAVAALLEPLFRMAGASDAVTHTVSFLIGFLIFSSLHIVIGEQVPKTFAIRRPETVSVLFAYPLHMAFLMVWPLNWVLNKTSAGILALFNVEEATHGDVFTDNELKDLVSTSQEHGGIEIQKAGMLRNLFEFDQHNVDRVMVPRHAAVTLDLADSPETNRDVVLRSGHSRFPVIDSSKNNRIVGVLLVKSLFARIVNPENNLVDPWSELEAFCSTPLVVPESQKSAILFELMREKRCHMALVVDEYGGLTGIVTLEDLLEEIVGDIEDETDDPTDPRAFHQVGEFSYVVNGSASLSDLERLIPVTFLNDVESNSISGLIMERLQHVPAVGSTVIYAGYEFTVLEMDGSRVATARIALPAGPPVPEQE